MGWLNISKLHGYRTYVMCRSLILSLVATVSPLAIMLYRCWWSANSESVAI